MANQVTIPRKELIEEASSIVDKIKLFISDDEYSNVSATFDEIKSFSGNSDEEFMSLLTVLMNNISHIANKLKVERESIQIENAYKKNKSWFTMNKPHEIIDKIQTWFHRLSIYNVSFCESIKSICFDYFNLYLNSNILNEIESFTLNDEINLIHLDMDSLCDLMLDKMLKDNEWCITNILNKDVFDLNDDDCFINYFLDNKLYSNNNNLTYMNNREGIKYWNNRKKELSNNQLNVGDIFILISDTLYAGFAESYYILDFHNKLRRIGIREWASDKEEIHLIIPVHITRSLYDPLKAYSAFIHQHCYDDVGGIQLELQIDNKCHIFNVNYKNLSIQREKSIIKQFGWTQRHFNNTSYRMKQQALNTYNPYSYSTIHIITDMGWYGCLIGYCNHPNVDKINLTQFFINVDKQNVGYIVNHNKENLTKNIIISNKHFDLLISGYYRETKLITNLCKEIIISVENFYKQRDLWRCDPGLKIIDNKKIQYVARNHSYIDYNNLNWLYAVSICKYSEGVHNLNVKIKKDAGSINIGIIESDKIIRNEESQFVYNTVGTIHINGNKIIHEFHDWNATINAGDNVRLKLDLNKLKLKCSVKIKSKWMLLKQIPIPENISYKFFVSMNWRKDCVVASFC